MFNSRPKPKFYPLMLVKRLLFLLCVLYFPVVLRAQTCTVLGQTPATAFPVCGTSVFQKDTVPICNNGAVPLACNDGAQYSDKNPFWYKFTCFRAGTLSFTIDPVTPSDDYDWQLFDVTNRNPSDVYTDASLFVSGNWSSNPGGTGTSSLARAAINCAGPAYPNMNMLPSLILGHHYLLLVSHFTDTQSGYSLSFNGGTASITDITAPAILKAQANCDATQISIVLNKKMKCNSLSADGSDFSLGTAPVTIVGSSGNSCSSGFDMDSVTLILSGPLPVGAYTVTARRGVDGNTLEDNCDVEVPVGSTVPLVIDPLLPTPMDSLTKPECAPNTLQLVFRKRIRCNTIAPDGSDFIVTGPSAVTVTDAGGSCVGGLSSTIRVQLSGPIVTGGLYQITLARGSDGNTIIDECGEETPAGAMLPFTLKDTVSADFTDQVFFGCKIDTIALHYLDRNGVDQWTWTFDDGDTSQQENPMHFYSHFGEKTIQLAVSNGFCSDTVSRKILLGNILEAIFEAPVIICPKDFAMYKNHSIGNISSWTWDFGDGMGSNLENPADHLYPQTGKETNYPIRLIVEEAGSGCKDTAVHVIDVLRSCYIAVPSAFTPNGDGLNDYLYPLNAYKADDLVFQVYNRYGQRMFETRDWTKKWDGRVGGQPQPPGTFVWTLQYTDRDTGRKFFLKGVSLLIR